MGNSNSQSGRLSFTSPSFNRRNRHNRPYPPTITPVPTYIYPPPCYPPPTPPQHPPSNWILPASSSAPASAPAQAPITNMAQSLPYQHVDSCLRALAGQAEGFGRQAIGGLNGPLHVVQNLHDDGPGSLRAACREKCPLWITFEVSGIIHLNSYLNISSHKTIDGRGQRIKFSGKGLRLKECENVIICNLEFEGGRGDDVDGIQIKPNSKNIWIDRCTLRDYDDGLIDITRQSTDITISRCYFGQHDKTMLIGADPSHVGDRCIRVTIHHCFFDGTTQRHPRVRFGKVHLYNNYTRNWGIYAVCASVESQIFSQCNIYQAGRKSVAFKYYVEKAADKEKEDTGCIISEADLFMESTQSGLKSLPFENAVFHPSEFYSKWTVEAPTESLRHILIHCSGWQNIPCPKDQPFRYQHS